MKNQNVKKFYVKLGDRWGYIDLCLGGRNDGYVRYYYFGASNCSKQSLYKVYDLVDSLIIKKLAILTSTGKTFIALIDEQKLETELRKLDEELPHHVIYFEKKEEK